MDTSKKILLIGLGLLIAYSAFIVWYSVQVFKSNAQISKQTTQVVQYINAGIATGTLPSIEDINKKLAPK